MAKRRRSKDTSELSVEFFRVLVEHSLDIVAVNDAAGNLRFVSPSVERVLGYPAGDLLEHGVFEFIHPDDQAAVGRMFEELSDRKGGIGAVECRVRHADGSWRTVAATGRYVAKSPILDGIVVNVRDVSERREAEHALRESRRRFRDITETVPDWLWEVDESIRFTYASPRIRDILGYDPEEVLGRTPFDHMPAEEAERVRAVAAPIVAAREPLRQVESVQLHKDGRQVIIQTSGVARFAADGTFIGYRGVDRDVTEARLAQRQVEDISKFPAEAPSPVLRVTPTGRILYANDVARGLPGLVEGEKLAAALRSDVTAAHESGERRWIEFESGERTFSFTLTPIAGKNYVNLYSSDITKIKQVQQELQASEASLEKVNRLLALIRQCNAILVRETDESELLVAICRLLTRQGDYLLAWVGYVEGDEQRSVRPVTVEGEAGKHVRVVKIDEGCRKGGELVLASAIRTGKSATATGRAQRGRRGPLRHGLASFAAIPLSGNDGVFGALNVGSGDPEGFDSDEMSLLEELASDLAFGITAIRERRRRAEAEAAKLELESARERALLQTIDAITRAAESRDPYTAGHEREVARLAEAMAREMGLSEDDCEGIRVAGLLHDVGKLQIPMEILARPTRLSALEYAVVKTHAEIGYNILKDVEFPWPVAEMVLQHHERIDGSGYPNGIAGDAIGLGGRILAVADTVEAMGNHRPYRASRGIDGALLHVLQGRGVVYDADAVNACLKLFEQGRFMLQQQ